MHSTNGGQARRVLFIVNSLRYGGAEKHVVSLLNHLDTQTFRLSLAYLKPENDLLPQISSERLESIRYVNAVGKFGGGAVRRLATQIDASDIDVVVCTNMYSMLYGVLASRLSKRRPRVMEVFHSTLIQGLKYKLHMAFYWPIFRMCDLLVYVCENQRGYWRAKGLRAAADAVVYNGIDVNHFSSILSVEEKIQLRCQYGIEPSDYLIGICAALRPEKAHGDLIEAVARLRLAGIAAKCLFVGEGVERTNLERHIAALNLQEHVKITGFQADVRPLIAICDVMTLVSHSETFSISALESMALGKPMVMSRIGGADEQVQPGINGYLFEAGDIDQLTATLAKLADVRERRAMGERASAIVAEKFSLNSMVTRFAALLSDEAVKA